MINERFPEGTIRNMTVRCPKCGHQQSGGVECEACGVIFRKASAVGAGFVQRDIPRAAEWTPATPIGALVMGADVLQIDQDPKGWLEVLLDWERANEYAVTDSLGRTRGYVVEQGRGFAAALRRTFLGSHRPLHLAVISPDERKVVLDLNRPWYFFLSVMDVTTPEGRKLGRIVHRWSFIRRTYDLEDETGRVFARIASKVFSIWTFPIFDPSGVQIAEVTKAWAGLMQEWMTDADKFYIRFQGRSLTEEQRAVIFAAALTIDFDFFENNTRRTR